MTIQQVRFSELTLALAATLIAATAAHAALPASPATLRAKEISAGVVSLTWLDRSNNESRFELQRGSSQQTLATISFPPANATSTGDTVGAGATRVYRIRANNPEGNSAFSNLCWLNANPPKPTQLAIVHRDGGIELSWHDNSSNEKGFRLQRRISGVTSFVTVANLAADATVYEDDTADSTSTYDYRVRANGRPKICIANSRWSNVAQSPPVQNGTHELTVTRSGTGSGSVASSPSGINCGTQCNASYATNTTVALTASPAAGSKFAGWSGACSGISSCSVMLNIDKSVGARFDPVSNCPTSGPLLNLQTNCSSRGYFYGSEFESVELVTNGASIDIYINDKSGELPEASLSGSVTSATTFHYDTACVDGLGCAPVDDDGSIQNSGRTLRLELQGDVFTYAFVSTGPALIGSVDSDGSAVADGAPLLGRILEELQSGE
ncbi:MAG TPA: hypothetical protein VN634_13605 [Candidatus Limnocylindrales bacterium]|nr:hypothetical protein [Candidatus Limnocylindrales bacterium]